MKFKIGQKVLTRLIYDTESDLKEMYDQPWIPGKVVRRNHDDEGDYIELFTVELIGKDYGGQRFTIHDEIAPGIYSSGPFYGGYESISQIFPK